MNWIDELLSLPLYNRQFIYIVDNYEEIVSGTKEHGLLENTLDVTLDTLKETIKDTYVPSRVINNIKDKKWGTLFPVYNFAKKLVMLLKKKRKQVLIY